MYMPKAFEETRIDVMHGLIRDHPLGLLVTVGSGGLNLNHVPFEVDPARGQFGTLLCHVARNNTVWQDFSNAVQPMVAFQGPSVYVSPNWYPGKQEHHKVVPTYNYAVVHARGIMTVMDDEDWVRGMVERLTLRMEAGQPQPWKVSDAPADFITSQLKHIVGIEIAITELTGKWKASQNRPAADQQGVIAGLKTQDTDATQAFAELMQANVAVNPGRT
jgi:transcriptional regulator